MFANILSRVWWMTLIRGLLWIAFGVIVFAWPGISLLSLALFFGATVFVDGVFNVANAVNGRKEHDQWWILLLVGLAGIGVAILMLLVPEVTALALVFYIAIWAVAVGVLQIVIAVRLRKEIEGELWLGLAGIASIVFGVLLVVNPAAGALAVLWLIAGYAIVFGVILVLLALRVRGLVKSVAGTVRA